MGTKLVEEVYYRSPIAAMNAAEEMGISQRGAGKRRKSKLAKESLAALNRRRKKHGLPPSRGRQTAAEVQQEREAQQKWRNEKWARGGKKRHAARSHLGRLVADINKLVR